MRIVSIIIFILVLMFIQVGILPHLAILGSFPNLILLSILSLNILQGWKKSLGWIIIGGLFLDFYSLHNVLGISIIALFFAGYLAYFLSQNIFKKTSIFSLFSIFLITIFLYSFILLISLKIFGISFEFTFLNFPIGIVYNLLFALPIFFLIKYVQGFKKVQNKKKI